METLNEVLLAWHMLDTEIAAIKESFAAKVKEEQELRRKAIELAFPEAKEGTNTLDLGNGWRLKANVKISRKVDEAALPAVKEKLAEMHVNADRLINYKPDLVLKEYRTLTKEQQVVMDEALEIKPSMPELALLEPAKEKA